MVNRNWMSNICNMSRVTTGLDHHMSLSHQTGLALPGTGVSCWFGEAMFFILVSSSFFLLVSWFAFVDNHVSFWILVLVMVADSFVCGFVLLCFFLFFNHLCCKLDDLQGPGCGRTLKQYSPWHLSSCDLASFFSLLKSSLWVAVISWHMLNFLYLCVWLSSMLSCLLPLVGCHQMSVYLCSRFCK